jgi:hypothetical protein
LEPNVKLVDTDAFLLIKHPMPTSRPFLLAACALALSMSASIARAGDDDSIDPDRPGFAESSKVVREGRVQLETSLQWERQRDDTEHSRTLSTPTLLRIGLNEAVELRFETEGRTIIHASEPGTGEHSTTAAYADTSAGFKWRFAEQKGNQPSLALLGEVMLPSGSGALRGKGARPALYVPAGWELDKGFSVEFMPGVGVDSDDDGRRYRFGFLAATLDKEISERLHGFVELAAPQIARAAHGGTRAVIDGGFTWQVSNDAQLDFSLIHGLNHRTPDLSLAFGLSIRR